MANVILISGTHHDGSVWVEVRRHLEALGHSVFAPDLTGLAPGYKPGLPINLDTHIDDVLAVIEANQLKDVILVGWSYGGMVITGAADRSRARVQALVYLDAAVPLPGQREWDLIDEDLQNFFLVSSKDGINIEVNPAFLQFRPNLMPHPLATKLQPLNYSADLFAKQRNVYVFAEKGFHEPNPKGAFEHVYRRYLTDSNWETVSLPHGHDLPTEAPGEVANIIHEAASAE
jgi:pimeloyl-ACP methyl ester carboxylesterase